MAKSEEKKTDLKAMASSEMEALVEQHNELVKTIQDAQGRLAEVKSMLIEKQGYLKGLEACEEECDKYYALHKEFLNSLSDCGIQEATYVRASSVSLLYFSIINTEENAEEILRRANEWRKKYDFKVDVITFDGEVSYQYRSEL